MNTCIDQALSPSSLSLSSWFQVDGFSDRILSINQLQRNFITCSNSFLDQKRVFNVVCLPPANHLFVLSVLEQQNIQKAMAFHVGNVAKRESNGFGDQIVSHNTVIIYSITFSLPLKSANYKSYLTIFITRKVSPNNQQQCIILYGIKRYLKEFWYF